MDELKIKKLIYRSKHRGCKETDIIMGSFAEQELPKFTKSEVDLYADFIEESDWDIYAWVNGNLEMPEKYRDNVGKKLMEFNLKRAAG